jgi:hypothetical protein
MMVVMVVMMMVFERRSRASDEHGRDQARCQQRKYPALHVSTSYGRTIFHDNDEPHRHVRHLQDCRSLPM